MAVLGLAIAALVEHAARAAGRWFGANADNVCVCAGLWPLLQIKELYNVFAGVDLAGAGDHSEKPDGIFGVALPVTPQYCVPRIGGHGW